MHDHHTRTAASAGRTSAGALATVVAATVITAGAGVGYLPAGAEPVPQEVRIVWGESDAGAAEAAPLPLEAQFRDVWGRALVTEMPVALELDAARTAPVQHYHAGEVGYRALSRQLYIFSGDGSVAPEDGLVILGSIAGGTSGVPACAWTCTLLLTEGADR